MASERRERRTGRERKQTDSDVPSPLATQRLDRWLFFARIVKSRTLAQKLCEAGHVRVNRVKVDGGAKAVRPGDVLTVSLSSGVRVLRIIDPGTRRGPATEARGLYEDVVAEQAARAASGTE